MRVDKCARTRARAYSERERESESGVRMQARERERECCAGARVSASARLMPVPTLRMLTTMAAMGQTAVQTRAATLMLQGLMWKLCCSRWR